MFSLKKDSRLADFCKEMIECIENKSITKDGIENQKILLAKKHGIFALPKNADLISYASEHGKPELIKFLKTKPVRTLSGVASIAVMWMPPEGQKSCPGECVYCPQSEDSPKAYTGSEPATMRAKRFGYDPSLQIKNRLWQFQIMGHGTDKCELIIMGGTFTAMPLTFQEGFIKKCIDALNCSDSASLKEAQAKNETAKNRCVGLTIETRADWLRKASSLINFGCTRVEMGIQTTSDELLKKINRGHDAQTNIDAIRRLKNSGLKFTAHWMPGLTGFDGEINIREEIESFKKLFSENYQPDELKIYPVLVLRGTKLHEMWKKGEYKALEKEQMTELLVKLKQAVPPYVRIKRVMRDISEHEAEAGAKTTNLRQLVREVMKAEPCRCIRCREIGAASTGEAKLLTREYDASEGREFFISFESPEKILAFVRLRTDKGETARIRELHVYGEMTPIGMKIAHQHHGLGKKLMQKAEETARELGKKTVAVTSGVGVRGYYRPLGYSLENGYMTKKMK
jgi:elongator complex protein 3